MNSLNSIILLFCSVGFLGSCTNQSEERPYSSICQTDFYGFPEVPGWNAVAYELDPMIDHVSGFYFITTDVGFLYNNSGIWKTIDQGKNWDNVYADEYIQFHDFSFSDPRYGVASVSKENIHFLLKTNDVGLSWFPIHSQLENKVEEITFVDSLIGFASIRSAADYEYGKTIDGGVTWQLLPDLSGPDYYAEDIRFFPDGFGYMPGNKGQIHLTMDHGVTWNSVESGLTDLQIIQFINPDTGFAANHNGFVKTLDGGTSWLTLSGFPVSMFHFFNAMYGISFQGINSGYFPGADWPHSCNAFLTTSDGGATWMEGPVSINLYLSSAAFPDENSGFIVTAEHHQQVIKLSR